MVLEASSAWSQLFTHLKRWATNLQRARIARKTESLDALRDVVRAVRKTAIYMRRLNSGRERALDKEEELSLLWTNLGFKLEELKLSALAKRCQISGKHWSDPSHYPPEFLAKADVSLESIERLALQTINEIKNHS